MNQPAHVHRDPYCIPVKDPSNQWATESTVASGATEIATRENPFTQVGKQW